MADTQTKLDPTGGAPPVPHTDEARVRAEMSKRFAMIRDLPKPLKDYLWSGQVGRAYQSVVSKQQIADQKLKTVASHLIGQVLIGELHPNSFIRKLAEQGSIDLDRARTIARDVSAQVFAPIRNELMKVYDISDAAKLKGEAPAVPKQKEVPKPKARTFLPSKKPAAPPAPKAPVPPPVVQAPPAAPPVAPTPVPPTPKPSVLQAPKQVIQPIIAQIQQMPAQPQAVAVAPAPPPPAPEAPEPAPEEPKISAKKTESKAKPAADPKTEAAPPAAKKTESEKQPVAPKPVPPKPRPEPKPSTQIIKEEPQKHHSISDTVEHAPTEGSIAEAAAQMHSGKAPPAAAKLPPAPTKTVVRSQAIRPQQGFEQSPQVAAQEEEEKPKGPALSPSELLAAEEVVASDDGKRGKFLSNIFTRKPKAPKKKKKGSPADTAEAPAPSPQSPKQNSGNTLNLRKPNLPS